MRLRLAVQSSRLPEARDTDRGEGRLRWPSRSPDRIMSDALRSRHRARAGRGLEISDRRGELRSSKEKRASGDPPARERRLARGQNLSAPFVANRHARCGFKSRLSHHLQLGIFKLFPGKKRLDRTRLNLQVCELAVQRAASGTHQASYP
jgi:hypothetical protein